MYPSDPLDGTESTPLANGWHMAHATTVNAFPSPADWTLLAVAAAAGETVSRVQLQKSLFLLGQQLPDEVGPDFYRFEPYNYGPFAQKIYSDAEKLVAQGFIIEGADRRWVEYAATPVGLRAAEGIKMRASPRAVAHLHTIVEWARRISFQDLLRAVYLAYPEFAVNSVFRG